MTIHEIRKFADGKGRVVEHWEPIGDEGEPAFGASVGNVHLGNTPAGQPVVATNIPFVIKADTIEQAFDGAEEAAKKAIDAARSEFRQKSLLVRAAPGVDAREAALRMMNGRTRPKR